MPDRTLLIRHIPEDLHRDFKALCAREGVTMGHRIRMIIDNHVKINRPVKVIVWPKEKGEG